MASKCVMNQTRKKDIRVELKSFDTCLVTALTFGWIHGENKTWWDKKNREDTRKVTKRIFQLSVTTTYADIIMATGI